MKRIISYISTLAFAALLVAGCAKDVTEIDGEGEGRLVFNLDFDGTIVTRAAVSAPESVTVNIGKPDVGYTHMFESLAAVPAELWLTNGTYFIEVTGGPTAEPAAPGFDEKLFFKGYKEFTINSNEVTVEVPCTVSTTLITVNFDATVPAQLLDYKATLFPVRMNNSVMLEIDEDNAGATAYLNLVNGQTEIDWTFTAAHKNEAETPVSEAGKLTNLAPGKAYTVNFKYTYSEKYGTLVLSVDVDESTVDIPTDITILVKPGITGLNFREPIVPTEGQKITIVGSESITDIVFSGSLFGAGYDILDAAGLTPPADYGLTITPINKGYEIELGMSFFEQVAQWGSEHPESAAVTITATDQSDCTHSVELTVGVTATTSTVRRSDIWATHATITGFDFTGATTARFAYRQTSSSEWTYVDATYNGEKFTAKLSGLTPGTAYEFDIETGGQLAGTVKTFTTEAATPLYNGGFENWWQDTSNGDKGTWYANASAAEKFWDSGNKGTVNAPMIGNANNNITKSAAPRPGSTGTKSAELKSNWFGVMGMGAFAAGNIYTGNFLEARADLSSPSGRVEFGRPFTSRPSAMKVYYKATTGTVNYAKSGAPISTGQQDKYRILIALSDRGSMREVDTADWNTILKFETDPDIIAFGEIQSSENVDWTEATIQLQYNSLTRVPTHIIVLASASMYGDYFAGSTSSVMYVDDFELVYDDNIVERQ